MLITHPSGTYRFHFTNRVINLILKDMSLLCMSINYIAPWPCACLDQEVAGNQKLIAGRVVTVVEGVEGSGIILYFNM